MKAGTTKWDERRLQRGVFIENEAAYK